MSKKNRLSYAQSVFRMYNDKQEEIFNLSEQSKNETIESIGRMSVGQVLKLKELILKRNERIQNGKKNVHT